MKKRRDKYAWLTADCFCGIKQLIVKKNAPAHITACWVHTEQAKRWVPESAALVTRALQMLSLVLQDHFQEFPVGTRDVEGNFSKRMCFNIDLAFQVNNKLMAVEVHGGAEHIYDQETVLRDKNKQVAWGEEVDQQSDGALPRCVGQILVIWAPALVPAEDGGPKSRDQWEQWVHDIVVNHVQQHML